MLNMLNLIRMIYMFLSHAFYAKNYIVSTAIMCCNSIWMLIAENWGSKRLLVFQNACDILTNLKGYLMIGPKRVSVRIAEMALKLTLNN